MRRLIARLQQWIARSVTKVKLVTVVAACAVPGQPSWGEMDRTKVRYGWRQERCPRAVSRSVRTEADRHDDLLREASTAVAR